MQQRLAVSGRKQYTALGSNCPLTPLATLKQFYIYNGNMEEEYEAIIFLPQDVLLRDWAI